MMAGSGLAAAAAGASGGAALPADHVSRDAAG